MDANGDFDLLDGLVAGALRAGADAADAAHVESRSLSAARRLGKPEALERAESRDLGLRVLVGRRQAVVSSTDLSPEALDELVERAVAMARVAPEDPFAGLAEPGETARRIPEIDMFDPSEPSPERLADRAAAAEDAALAVAGVTNSEGGEAAWSANRVALLASNGFRGAYRRSSHSVSAVALAGEGQGMERDYEYSTATHEADLEDAAAIGREAGERAARRLGPRRPASAAVPVVYGPRVSGGLVGHLAAALNGASVARGVSFLKDRMDTALFAPGIAVTDDPLRPRGRRSRPFDAEGIATARRALVEDGHVRSWLLDLATARQLGLATLGHAARAPGGVPSPAASNLCLAAGTVSPAELMSDIKSGLYITELMGASVNMATGDYSRGAGGFWIENGEIAWPVSDITVAGNLLDMYARLVPADDLEFRRGIDAPTVRIDGMTVAGPGG